MSSLELRERLKRELSFSGSRSGHSLDGSSSHGSSRLPAAKRSKSSDDDGFRRKVSFGQLDETVLFDKKESSSNLSMGVSVSRTSFGSLSRQGSSANFRWGESGQLQAGGGNATWGAPPPPRESRWQCGLPVSSQRKSGNMFLQRSAATANAFRSLAQAQTTGNLPVRSCSFSQARLPTRCASPTQETSMEVERGVARATSFTEPPRRPGRCESPASFGGPPVPPGARAAPTFATATATILPVPIHSISGVMPRLPRRSTSPVTVTPRTSFTM